MINCIDPIPNNCYIVKKSALLHLSHQSERRADSGNTDWAVVMGGRSAAVSGEKKQDEAAGPETNI